MEIFPDVSELKPDETKLDLGCAMTISRTKNSGYGPVTLQPPAQEMPDAGRLRLRLAEADSERFRLGKKINQTLWPVLFRHQAEQQEQSGLKQSMSNVSPGRAVPRRAGGGLIARSKADAFP